MIKKILLFFIFSLAFSSTAFSDSLSTLQDLPVIEKTFDNGLQCVVQEYPGSGLVALNLTFKTGSVNEGAFLGYGISHLIEHLMIRSSQKYPREGEIEKLLKTLGGTFNASTSTDTVSIYITVPKNNLVPAIELIKEMAFFPNFTEEHVQKEKEVVLKEIILHNDNPDSRISELTWRTAFHVLPYQHPIIGYPLLFKTITADDVKRSYSRFTPNIAVLAVAGDVCANDIFTVIDKNLSDLPLPNYAPEDIPAEPPQSMPRLASEMFDTPLARLTMAFASPGVLNSDIAALDLIAVILGQGNSSRLNKKIIEELQIAQSVDASNDTLFYTGLFTINATLKPEHIVKVEGIILDQIKSVQEKIVPLAEIIRAKKLLRSSYILTRSSLDAVAASLSAEKALTGDSKFSQKYIEAVDKITQDQIQKVAKKYFSPEKVIIAKLFPKSHEQKDVKKPAASFAQDLPWKTKTLKNGIKVIAIQNTLIPKISMTFIFKGGLLAENDSNNGISKLCAKLLLRSWKNPEALTSSFEDRGASINPIFDNNSFGIQTSVLKEDFLFALTAVAEVLKDPVFPEKEITRIKNLCLLDIQTDNDNMFRHGLLDLKKAIYKDHPYARRASGTEKSISALTRKNIIDFYKHYGTATNMVISCAGDIEPDKAIDMIERSFSTLPRSSLPILLSPKGVVPITANENITIRLDREGSMIFFGYTGIRLTDKDIFPLDTLASIMSGHNGRLLYSIRNNDNLTYIQNFFNLPSYDNGFLGAFAGTSPEKQDQVIKGIEEQLSLLAQNGITDKEISDAKTEMTTKYLVRRQQNDFLSAQAAISLLYGVDIDWFFSYDKNISNVTKKDIETVIDRYIKNRPFVRLLLTSGKSEQ